MHKLDEVTLFEPRKGTGQLGRVRHSYNPKNPYAAILGNTFIPLAPFFGGAAVIYLATAFLMPELAPGKGLPEGTPVTASALLEPSSYQTFAKRSWAHLGHLKDAVMAGQSWRKWQFYAYIYIVFCIGTHLAPSASDFENFRTPALLLVVLLYLASLVVSFFGDLPRMAIEFLRGPVVSMTGLLSFTMAMCLVGAVITTALTAAVNLCRK
jgi:hypothetical protein